MIFLEEIHERQAPIYKDERGMIRDLKAFSVEELHIATMQSSAIRGDHIHEKDEIICIIGGSGICEIIVQDEMSGKREKVLVEGDMKTYRIKAGLKHIVRNTGNDAFYLVCFYE
jgi:oxalate decarboxylase/phosphoglucose isomerase-like protein (cupin superfamily)